MLRISPATLRRMALFYEAAFIPLPSGKGGRIYPDEVLKQFQAAKQLVDERRAGSLENAFLILAKTGVDADEVLAVHTSPHEALGALRQELRAVIKQEVTAALQEHHARRDAELERRNAYLEAELKRRDEAPPRRGWWPWGRKARKGVVEQDIG